MRKTLSIIHYEYRMQITRLATWGVFLIAMVVSLLDDFPSGGNLHRLEFLTDPAYFVSRTMSQHGLTLAFGLMILLSNCFSVDQKTGVKALIMASLVTRFQYILGKIFAGFIYAIAILSLFLAVNGAIYCLSAQFQVSIGTLLAAVVKTIIICVLPVSAFVGFLAVSLPALIDVRLFYALTAVLFIVSESTVGTSEAMPFYCITSGDLIKLIWHHPKWEFIDNGSIQANLAFLLGGGLLPTLLLFVKRSFWRHE